MTHRVRSDDAPPVVAVEYVNGFKDQFNCHKMNVEQLAQRIRDVGGGMETTELLKQAGLDSAALDLKGRRRRNRPMHKGCAVCTKVVIAVHPTPQVLLRGYPNHERARRWPPRRRVPRVDTRASTHARHVLRTRLPRGFNGDVTPGRRHRLDAAFWFYAGLGALVNSGCAWDTREAVPP